MIPIKLRIATRHILPPNNRVSLFDQMQSDPMEPLSIMAPSSADIEEENDFLPSLDAEEADTAKRLEALIDAYFTASDEENIGRYIFTTEAAMEITPEEITIQYEESPENNLDHTSSTVRIFRKIPHMLSIERTGTLMNTLICETGRRHMSVYQAAILPRPMEVSTYTRKCDIDLDEEGGIILLDYIVEIRGADVQRTTIRMDITPLT